MQPPRVFVFTGLPPAVIQSQVLIILLFAGSLSTVRTAVLTEQPLKDNDTSTQIPRLFSEDSAHLSTTVTSDVKLSLKSSMGNESLSELDDMMYTTVNKANATVDSDDSDVSVQDGSTTEYPTESDTQTSLASSSISTIVSNSTELITSNSTSTVSTEESSLADSTVSSPTSTTPTSTMTTTETTERTTMNAPTAGPETDQPESSTAKTLTEDNRGMPTGIVALVTLITFAIIAFAGYVSLVVWRRYLEYKYGNRELLVNDLEFDTNDLRHFEL